MTQMASFPDHIKHKPVYVVPYFALDHRRPKDTDVQFITLGWSQWDDEELSAKVMRHSGNRWSRQSEELPLSRVVDLAILIALALENGEGFTKIEDKTFEHQDKSINVAHGSQRDREAAAKALHGNVVVRNRLCKLYDILHRMRGRGMF